jgi:hypothetical protein
MEPQCLVERGEQIWWYDTDATGYALDRDGSDLFSLRFGIAIQPCLFRLEQHLEGMHTPRVRGHLNNCDHPATKALGGAVRSLVADDHGRPTLVRLGAAHEIHQPYLCATHQAKPSPLVVSHSSASPSLDQLSQASS